MSSKWAITVKPSGRDVREFKIPEPLRESKILIGKKEFVRVVDNRTVMVLEKRRLRSLLSEWGEPGQIELAGKHQNIVETVLIPSKSLKLVFKSGTAQKVQREFENYCYLQTITGLTTLDPLGYVSSKIDGQGFIFTALAPHVIPLSAINYSQVMPDQRDWFIKAVAHVLSIMHSHGITHNDSKLKNFLYPNKGRFSFPMVIDLVKMNRARAKVCLNPDLDLTDIRMQDLRYDLYNFLGSAVFHGLITDINDLKQFVRFYFKARHKHCEEAKPKPHQVDGFVEKIQAALALHTTDKNIQNLRRIYGMPPLPPRVKPTGTSEVAAQLLGAIMGADPVTAELRIDGPQAQMPDPNQPVLPGIEPPSTENPETQPDEGAGQGPQQAKYADDEGTPEPVQ